MPPRNTPTAGRAEREPPLDPSELKAVRDALAQSEALWGLRETARQLRMSPTGLRGLLNGSAPYGKTVRRLRAWFAGWLARQGKGEAADEMALNVLVSTLAEERREAARERLRATLIELRAAEP